MVNTDPRALVEAAREHANRLVARGATCAEVLNHLATTAEKISGPGTAVSILVLDEEGLLRNGASPNLPTDYLARIDRLRPDANVGTCASAAATGEVVVTPDFLEDGKWDELRHLPLALGFVGAWSQPIKQEGKVLGTFGTYYRDRREPTLREREAVSLLAAAAAMAIRECR